LALSLGLDGIGCSVQPSRDFGIFETSLILEVKKTQRGVDKAASAILAVLLSSSAKNVNKDQRLTNVLVDDVRAVRGQSLEGLKLLWAAEFST